MLGRGRGRLLYFCHERAKLAQPRAPNTWAFMTWLALICVRRGALPSALLWVHAGFHLLYTALAWASPRWCVQTNIARVEVGTLVLPLCVPGFLNTTLLCACALMWCSAAQRSGVLFLWSGGWVL